MPGRLISQLIECERPGRSQHRLAERVKIVDGGETPDDTPIEINSEERQGRPGYLVGQVESSALARVLRRVDIPLIVHDGSGMILLANQPAAELVGVALDEMVGTPVTQFVSPVNLVDKDVTELTTGRFEGFTAHRTITPRGGNPTPVYAIAFVIEVDGERLGVGMCVSRSELGRLGRHPQRFSSDLIPIAVGLAREDWTIVSISSEAMELIGRLPADCVGLRLMDMIHPEDATELIDQFGRALSEPFVIQGVRFATSSGQWIRVSVLTAPVDHDSARIRFALVGRIDEALPQLVDADQELELRLRRIGAELRAAGLVSSMGEVPTLDDDLRMGQLTSKQWDILIRLLQGERVTMIANALFISPSTVRNHLSAIFRLFGVHSQAELIEYLRSEER